MLVLLVPPSVDGMWKKIVDTAARELYLWSNRKAPTRLSTSRGAIWLVPPILWTEDAVPIGHSQKTSDGRLTASRTYMVRSRGALFKARRRTVVEPPATAVCAEHDCKPRICPPKTLTTSSHIRSISGSLAPLTRRERAPTRGKCLKGRARIVLNALGESRRGDASTVGARTGCSLDHSNGPCGPRVGSVRPDTVRVIDPDRPRRPQHGDRAVVVYTHRPRYDIRTRPHRAVRSTST